MTDDVQDAENGPEEGVELQPVKHPHKRMLYIGTTLVVGGTILAFVIPQLFTQRTMGVTRTARLDYEQRKADAETVNKEQTNQDSQTIPNEETYH